MGIIASVTTLTVTSVIARQRKNATINSMNGIYSSATALLVQVSTDSYDENITIVDENLCYISLTTLIDSGNVDGNNYKPKKKEVYFCYNKVECYAIIAIGTDDISDVKPSETNSTSINGVELTFNFDKKEFVIA